MALLVAKCSLNRKIILFILFRLILLFLKLYVSLFLPELIKVYTV